MDRISIVERSKNMSAVRSTGNKTTEIRLVEIFKKNKISGWRRHLKIYGRPDFVFLKDRKVVFVDGCFWHGCKCKTIPKQNRSFWSKKIKKNIERDKEVGKVLRKEGWKVIRIKEHQLKEPKTVLKKLHS